MLRRISSIILYVCLYLHWGFFKYPHRALQRLTRLGGCWVHTSFIWFCHTLALIIEPYYEKSPFGGFCRLSTAYIQLKGQRYDSLVTRKPFFGVSNQVRLNRPAQLQRLARGLKFRIKKLEVLYYLRSEQQRCWSDCADVRTVTIPAQECRLTWAIHICDIQISSFLHEIAHIKL